jgi:hypothetical protein
MSYYIQEKGGRHPNVVFTPDDFAKIFYYNVSDGYPAYSETTLLDIGKMRESFEYGRNGTFSDI